MLLCYFVTDGNLKICYKNQTLSTRYLLGIYSVSTLLFRVESWETFAPKIIENYRKLDKNYLETKIQECAIILAQNPHYALSEDRIADIIKHAKKNPIARDSKQTMA